MEVEETPDDADFSGDIWELLSKEEQKGKTSQQLKEVVKSVVASKRSRSDYEKSHRTSGGSRTAEATDSEADQQEIEDRRWRPQPTPKELAESLRERERDGLPSRTPSEQQA